MVSSLVIHDKEFKVLHCDKLASDRKIINLSRGCRLILFPNFYSKEDADTLFDRLLADTKWEEHHRMPRLVAWVGDFDYDYSGASHVAQPWSKDLTSMQTHTEETVFGSSTGQFQGVLLNLYRDGRHSVGFHADDEPEIRRYAPIASVSLGAERDFVLKSSIDPKRFPNVTVRLPHGSLAVMVGKTQLHWKHSIPKDPKVTTPRINLTFRQYQFGR